MNILAHITQTESPIGLFVFLSGFAAGLATAYAAGWATKRSRQSSRA